MDLTQRADPHKVLLVDDDDAVRSMVSAGLQRKGFHVVTAGGVTEALKQIATQGFDVLITDLHMPNPGDGFTVVTAMRHSQPHALTLLVSGYPDVQGAMAAILLEADEIIVKPFEIGRLTELVKERVLDRRPTTKLDKERVGVILQRCVSSIVENWLKRAKQSRSSNTGSLVLLTKSARTMVFFPVSFFKHAIALDPSFSEGYESLSTDVCSPHK